MQGVKMKQLGNGRGQQSNFMVSNDGIQVMDLPRTMGAPRKAIPSGRTTPILIPPVKYLVYNNPQVAYDFLVSKGYNVEPNIPSTYQFARIFIKERGDEGILELTKAAHPDRDLILKATGHKDDSSFCCGFNGDNQTPEQKQNTAEQVQAIKEEAAKPSEPAQKSETKTEGGIKINTQTIIIILVIVVFFLLINRATK